MNDQPSRTKRILTVGIYAVTALLLVFLAIQIVHAFMFRVVSTDPATKKVSTTAPFFKVNFSRDIKSQGLVVQSSPSGFTGSYTINGKVLTIPFTKQLTAGKTYTIMLSNVQSTGGKMITSKTFTFKPYFITSAKLSPDQRQALLNKEDIGSSNPKDPIIKYLPYQTTDFLLDQNQLPQKDETKFALEATIYLSISDVSDDAAKAAATAQYEQEVTTYISSLGLNPDNYAVNYIVENP